MKRSQLKVKSDRGKQFYNSIFQNSSKLKKIHHYSRFTDKGPSIAERVIKTVRNLQSKPVFLAGNAKCLSEKPSIMKKYNNTIRTSTKKTPIEASMKVTDKIVFSYLQN